MFILAESAHEGRKMSAADDCKSTRSNVDSELKSQQKHSRIDADYFTSSVTKKHLYNVRDQHRASQRIEIEYRLEIFNSTHQDMKINR